MSNHTTEKKLIESKLNPSKWRCHAGELAAYLYLFGYDGLYSLVNNDAVTAINRKQHNAVVIGVLCFLSVGLFVRWLAGHRFSSNDPKVSIWLFFRVIFGAFLAGFFSSYLNDHYGVALGLKLYGIYWGVLALSLLMISASQTISTKPQDSIE